jgi:ubiquinone/menaquinone biosynthesis C-methylase UbiE
MSDDTREYFESVAPKWDEMRRLFFGEGVRNAAIAAANITSSSIVADVGTGTGFIAEGALTAGARVIGVDASIECSLKRESGSLKSGSKRGRAMLSHCRLARPRWTLSWRTWYSTTRPIRPEPFAK